MPADRSRRDLVVMGASAGGVEVLKKVVAALPPDLAASVCIVLHIAPSSPSALARILQRSGPLRCHQAADGDELRVGEIFVAAPDRHIVVEDGHLRLTSGPRENGHRPAIDTLFRSAARARGGNVIGVVLSGNRDDGAAGLATIKAGGGAAIVQDPDEALYPSMPSSAIATVAVDAVVPSGAIADTIAAMVNADDRDPPGLPDPPDDRNDPPTSGDAGPDNPSISVCPECGGVLTERRQAGVTQWTCHVGHRYSPESLADEQAATVEAAMWTAIRALDERTTLLERMAEQANARAQPISAHRFRDKASDAREQAQVVRAALERAVTNALRDLAADAPSLGQLDTGSASG